MEKAMFLSLLSISLFLPVHGSDTPETSNAREYFTEELLLRPLADGRVLAHFHFEQYTAGWKHPHTFPRAIDQLSRSLHFKEIEIAFTRGRWNYQNWGEPLVPAKPTGAELIAQFPKTTPDASLPNAWGNLTHALSGLLCASLNFLERKEMVLQPEVVLGMSRGDFSDGVWLYATLPQEPICTENLTPWLKLLPCGDVQGLAALMGRTALFGADYQSLLTNVRVLDSKQSGRSALRLVQTLTLVLKSGQNPLLVPNSWSLKSLLKATNTQAACSVSDISTIYLDLPDPLTKMRHSTQGHPQGDVTGYMPSQESVFSVHPQPDTVITASSSTLLKYNLGKDGGIDLSFEWKGGEKDRQRKWVGGYSGWVVQSYLKAIRGDSGGLVIESRRVGQDRNVHGKNRDRICMLQTVPWFVKIWLHSMKMKFDGKDMPADVVFAHHFHVSEERQSPWGLEICIKVGPSTATVAVSFDFTKGFLSVTEHPPDAHRGFDVPSALVLFLDEHVNGSMSVQNEDLSPLERVLAVPRRKQAYTEGTLVHLATPDFSMPYNVCCMTSTVLAVYIGVMLKALTRRPDVDELQSSKQGRGRKIVRVVGVGVLMGGLLLYVDSEMRDTVQQFLADMGVMHPPE